MRLLVLLFFFSCSHYQQQSTNKLKLTILHTNDHHGRFWSNKKGEYGLAARSTLIKKIRKEVTDKGGHVLLLDAGDVNTGVPESDLLHAEPDFKGMKALGYDAMALGNHEFDNPYDILSQQQKWADFPFISANIYHKNGERLFPSHITKIFDHVKVTIIGLTTEDTPFKSNSKNSKHLVFKSVVEEAKDIVPDLKKKSDILIAVTHAGHYPNQNHGPNAPGDVSIARATKGIDLIVGGHTQIPLFKPDVQNGTLIVQAYEWGKYLGRLDLEYAEGKVKLLDYKLIPVNLKNSTTKIAEDSEIIRLLLPYKKKGALFLKQKIGKVNGHFVGRRDLVRSQETNLGNFVAKVFKEKLKADLSIINSGGIRDSLNSGNVTMEDVLKVLPFGGEIVLAQFSGKELKEYLTNVLLSSPSGTGAFPQVSGVEMTFNKSQKRIDQIKINGKKLQEKKMYKMALPEFIALGGDKYPPLKYTKYGFIDAQILADYFKHHPTINADSFGPFHYLNLK